MQAAWLSVALLATVLLLATCTLERQIKAALRARWSSFDYDGLTVLTWGVAALGTMTMLVFLTQALDQTWPGLP